MTYVGQGPASNVAEWEAAQKRVVTALPTGTVTVVSATAKGVASPDTVTVATPNTTPVINFPNMGIGPGGGVAIGINTPALNFIHASSVAIGSQAMQAGTPAEQGNVAVGNLALGTAQGARDCVAIGRVALGSAVAPGAGNHLLGSIAIGFQSLHDPGLDAVGNIGIGYQAGNGITTGEKNVVVGDFSGIAGPSPTTGSHNIAIGTNTDIVPTDSNQVDLNGVIFKRGANQSYGGVLVSDGTNTDILPSSGGTLALRVNAATDIASAATGDVLAKAASGAVEFITPAAVETTHVIPATTGDVTLVNDGTNHVIAPVGPDGGTPAPYTVTLPAAPVTNGKFTVKDKAGTAATHNITIAGNGKMIDGLATLVLAIDTAAATMIYDGTEWILY